MRRLLLALPLIALALPAHADGAITRIISAQDKQRLANYDKTRAEALKEARSGGSAGDLATLDKVLAPKPTSFNDFDMTGAWQCRTIKAGGNLPLVVYGWFRCEVTDDGSGWAMTKVTGSQRTFGRFYTESDTRQTYLGGSFIAGQKPGKYGAGPKTDQVGYAFRTGKSSFRIEFPAPALESKLDILELKR